jgi:hypothetical protein
MLRDEDKAAICDGKEAFERRSHAVAAARRRKGREVYRCQNCRKWHVGTKAAKPFRFGGGR